MSFLEAIGAACAFITLIAAFFGVFVGIVWIGRKNAKIGFFLLVLFAVLVIATLIYFGDHPTK